MYFFRKQYETKNIPSVLLWQEWMNEFEAQKWWKKLQHHLLLYLQLLALLLLIFTLAQPFFNKDGLKGNHIVIILDTSASMTAKEDGKSRLQLAKEEARTLLSKVEDQSITLVHAKEFPEIIVEKTMSSKEVIDDIDAMESTYGNANLLDSIELAKNLLGDEEGQIHVLTDNLSKEADLTFHENTTFVAYNLGTSSENLALNTFGVASQQNKMIGVVTIKNEGKSPKEAELVITNNDGTVLEKRTENIEANSSKNVYIENLPPSDVYKAVITGDHAYELDNELYAFSPIEETGTVYLHGTIHPFARKAAEIASEDVVHLTSAKTEIDELSGIHILQGMPKDEWPMGPKLIFVAQEDGKKEASGEMNFDHTHALMQSVEIDKVYVDSVYTAEVFKNMEVIAKKGDSPLIKSGEFEGSPAVVVLFDLSDSDWPLHTGFPLFMYHAIQQLTEKQEKLGYFYPGQYLDFVPDPKTEKLEFFNFDNNLVRSYNDPNEAIQVPAKPGLYTFKEVENGQELSKKLYVMLPDGEKTTKSDEGFTVSAGGATTDSTKANVKMDISYVFILLALFILFLEWEVYRRGIST